MKRPQEKATELFLVVLVRGRPQAWPFTARERSLGKLNLELGGRVSGWERGRISCERRNTNCAREPWAV